MARAPLLAHGGSGPRSLDRPPCPRVPPLAAAAPALTPYLELRHPDVGGARPAAPPRLAPARGRRRPAAQPSRASRGRPSPRTPGLRPPRLAPHFLAPLGGRAALPAAAARGKSRPGPAHRSGAAGVPLLPRSAVSPEPGSFSPLPANPRPRHCAARRPARRLRSPALGTWARLPGGQGAPAASGAGRQPRPGARFLVGVSPPGLRVGGRASPGRRRAALGHWAHASSGSILVPS